MKIEKNKIYYVLYFFQELKTTVGSLKSTPTVKLDDPKKEFLDAYDEYWIKHRNN